MKKVFPDVEKLSGTEEEGEKSMAIRLKTFCQISRDHIFNILRMSLEHNL